MKVLGNSVGRPAGLVSRLLALAVFGLVSVLLVSCGGAGTGSDGGEGAAAEQGAPSIKLDPADGSEDVSPLDAIKATVDNGEITEAVLTNEQDEEVKTEISQDGSTWEIAEPLGYGKTYTASVTAEGDNSKSTKREATFTTVEPKHKTYVSMNPLDGQTVGVGQPLAFYFSSDSPAPDKERAEEAIRIKTDPQVEGAFYWFDDREVHWRPKEYWEPGTKVTVDIDVYGKKLGEGLYGEEDREATITIGDSVVLRADGASHQMSVEVNGSVQRTIPVALGKPDFPSNNGAHVVTEHHEKYLMDSTTYGLPLDDGGYKTEVKWAVRISNGGEFLHAAPWAAGDLGNRNVSHGCINMTDADAKWVFDLLKKGDVVEVTNSGGPDLRSWDGFGDWQVPWSEWVQGNK
ncbi:L,D-transpeptidase [Parasphingorhabdus pacifica]